MLADGIVAHAHDAMVEVRDDRLRVVRLAATDEDGPVVILDVGAEEVLRTAWAVKTVPGGMGGDGGDANPGGGDDGEQVLVLDIVMRDPDFDPGQGPMEWAPLRIPFPLEATDDVRALRSAIHAGSARRRVADPVGPDPVPATPPPPHPDHPNTPRADLAAAIDRMAHRDAPSTAALHHLRHYPRPDEVFLEVMAATHANMPGVLAVTTTRVLFAHDSAKTAVAHEFPVDAIQSVEGVANDGERPSAVKIVVTSPDDWFLGVGNCHWQDVERFTAALRWAIGRRRKVGATLPSEPGPTEAFRMWEELTLAAKAGTIGAEEHDAKMSGVLWTAGF